MLTLLGRKFLFIKTKKTASTSVEILLSSFCDKTDILTPLVAVDEHRRYELTKKVPQNYCSFIDLKFDNKILNKLNNVVNRKHYNHQTYYEILKANNSLKSAKPLSLVRHPLSQAKSNILWLQKSQKLSLKSATEYFLSSEFVGNSQIIAGMPTDTTFIKYENLKSDLAKFCDENELIIDINTLLHTKKSETKSSVQLNCSEISQINQREKRILQMYD